MSTGELTRENRYEGLWRLKDGARVVPEDGEPGPFSQAIIVTWCKSCGSMVRLGSEGLHERMHPRISCEQLDCEVRHGQARDGTRLYGVRGHPWEDQFR